MISTYASDFWTASAPALGNHLWQSTLFAAVAGLLTLLLRKNHAAARYWLWLIASLKFLLPFSLLVSLGNYLSPASNSGSNGDFYLAMETMSRPFPQSFPKTTPSVAPIHTTFIADLAHLLPAILALSWLIGFLAVLLMWFLRWRRISSAMRAAVLVQEGREVETLRRMEHVGGIRRQIKLLLSRSSLEPGIFGIARPVLVWPEGISGRLDDAHLQAILAHEVWHVRRKDNLAAVVHMLVEAIFWFHPLVWWLGARLVEERERACDEEVLQLGNPPQIYAESILKICEFCVGSPLACVAGVTGADLKKRIVYIMNERIARKLDFTRKLLLTAVGLIAVALPVIFGLVKPAQSRAESQVGDSSPVTPGFISVSIKPGVVVKPGDGKIMFSSRLLSRNDDLSGANITLLDLIEQAYGVEKLQVLGAPDWVQSERFDIDAKVDPAIRDARKKLTPEQANLEWKRMSQALLADRFHLVVHQETRDLPGYSLVIAKNGPKLQKAKFDEAQTDGGKGMQSLDNGPAVPHKMMFGFGELTGQAISISSLAKSLSARLGHPVVDNTGLTGDFDFKLQWTPSAEEFAKHKAEPGDRVPDPSGPQLTAAIEEQLGLRLNAQTVPRAVVVIDRAERPDLPQSQNTTSDAGIESASIKPNLTGEAMPPFKIFSNPPGKGVGVMFNDNEYRATNITLRRLLRHAYGLQDTQISGGPDWFDTDRFDVIVRFSGPVDTGANVRDQRKLTLQSLLSHRFKLAVHQETQNLPVYVLTVDADHPKLQAAKAGDTYPNGVKRRGDGHVQGPGFWTPADGQLVGQGVPVQYLLPVLSDKLGGSVILDKTGLSGQYDFNLQFPSQGTLSADALAAAVHDQLGLKLVQRTEPMQVLLIDHAEKLQSN